MFGLSFGCGGRELLSFEQQPIGAKWREKWREDNGAAPLSSGARTSALQLLSLNKTALTSVSLHHSQLSLTFQNPESNDS